MLPRHPLIFKLTIICATILLLGLLFYQREPNIIVTRNVVVVTEESPPLMENGETSARVADNVSDVKQEVKAIPVEPTTTTDSPTKAIKYVDGESLMYSIDQEGCTNEIYLVIYIHSNPENSERRRVIRNTWATTDILGKHKAKLVFVTGQVQSEDLQATLETESDLYHDLVQANFTDTYRNLTFKAIAALKWVSQKCPSPVYVLKTDDDIVVDIHRVVRLMRSYIEHKWGKTNILSGYIWPHMNVERNKSSKWYTSEDEFPNAFFLQYCSGSAYIMSGDVVGKFYNKSLETPFFWVDDYYVTGMLAHSTNIKPMSLNDRYILENKTNMKASLDKDIKTRFVFVHSPNTTTSKFVWQQFLDRW